MNKLKIGFTFIFLILFAVVQINAEGVGKKTTSLKKTNGQPSSTHFNINNVSTWIYDNGDSDIDPYGNGGFIYPKGSNKNVVFESGLVWGAKVNGKIRVGGSTYQQGLLPGRILPDGTAMSPDDPGARIYRVRPDWKTGDVSSEINDGEGTEAEIRAQYEKDWNEWPADWGAPYTDVDGDGKYNPSVDIPGVPGADQTVWFVANDLDDNTTKKLYGSPHMGIEMQATMWGYKSTSALGNMMFRKYVIINRSSDSFDSMFVSYWADCDLGGFDDDFVGCDVDLSLMYTYNGDAIDQQYGKTVPAIGFDFFQGPIVPTGDPNDKAVFHNKIISGYKNLPMSAHYFFINGDPIYTDPPLGDYEGSLEFWNLFNGRVTTTGAPFVDPTTGQETKFALAGDPVAGTGWIDGILHPPGDRRNGMVSGPFTMAAGDTQEVVIAEIAAGGFGNVDRLGAVSLLKFYDKQAQAVYDNLFQVPKTPPTPQVTVRELDREVLLRWDTDPNIDAIENFSDAGFNFEGYVIYQLPSRNASFNDAKMLATFDIIDGIGKVIGQDFDQAGGIVLPKVLKFGSESGLQRQYAIKGDAFNSGARLRNGTKYYFAVTAYAVNPDPNAVPNVLESPLKVLEVVPQTPPPGSRVEGKFGEALTVKHTNGISEGTVDVTVVDPTQLTGKTYSTFFHTDLDTNSATYGQTVWGLKDGDGNKIVDNMPLFAPDAKGIKAPPIIDGMSIKIMGPPPGIKDWNYSGNRWVSGVNWGGSQFFGGMDNGFNFFGSTITDGADFVDMQLKWAGDDEWASGTPADVSAAALAAKSQSQYPDRWSKAAVYRRDQGYAIGGYGDIPFAAYDVSDPNNPRRTNICFVEDDRVAPANNLWDMGWDGTSFQALGAREYIFIMKSDYDQAAEYDNNNWGPVSDVLYAIWPQARGSRPYLLAPFEMDIYSAKVLTKNDVYTFTAPKSVSGDKALEKQDVENINVFPNPYYGVNPDEINKYQRFVTFTHLPQKATIRVFNLAGQLVKTIVKNDNTQFAKWDLKNESNLPVASGLYVAYIDMPSLGKTKILKLAIIQETQILDRF